MTRSLNRGDAFPQFVVNLVDGKELSIPEDLRCKRNVLLFYRGSW